MKEMTCITPVDRLCSGFMQYRQVRCNIGDYEYELEALGCKPSWLLLKNLMYLALHPKMNCLDCRLPCDIDHCGYNTEMVFTAGMILKHFRMPRMNVLRKVKKMASRQLKIRCLEYSGHMFFPSFSSPQDKKVLGGVNELLSTWRVQNQKEFYDYLDLTCRQMKPVCKALGI